MKHLKKILISILTLGLVSFTILNTLQEDKSLIIGTWIPEGSPGYEWVFYNNGTCYQYDNGALDSKYNYTIEEEISNNGKLKFSILKIKDIDNPSDTYEYDINGISKNEMYLDYLGDMNTKLLKYTRK